MPFGSKRKVSHLRKKLYKFVSILKERIPGLEGLIIMRYDGLVITHVLPEKVDEYLFSAIAVSIFSVSQKAFNELNYGDLNYIVLHGSKKQLVISCAGDFIFCFLASGETKLHFILQGIFEITQKISELLEI